MSDHLITEANRHAQALPKMQLPTTQPTHRDIAWYADECADLKKLLASLERQNAALRADKERLDSGKIMLLVYDTCDGWQTQKFTAQNLRAAIDAARKEEAE